MKILLVGGQSSLAKSLLPALANFANVVTAGRSGCEVELDLTWAVERFAIPAGVDVVINLVGHFGGPAFSDLLAAEEVNALGSLKLAHACANAGVTQFLQVSSIFAGLTEDSHFYNAYALSKRHAEELLQLYCRQVSLHLAILRPAQIYGEGDEFRRHQPFIYALLDKAQRGEEIVLYGRNDARRNFIHIEDVVEIISRVVRQRIEGCYVCAGLENVRFSDMAAAAVAAFGGASAVRFDVDKPDIPDNAFEADETLYRLINFRPRISLEIGFAREAWRRRAGS